MPKIVELIAEGCSFSAPLGTPVLFEHAQANEDFRFIIDAGLCHPPLAGVSVGGYARCPYFYTEQGVLDEMGCMLAALREADPGTRPEHAEFVHVGATDYDNLPR